MSKAPRLEELQRELVALTSGLEHTPQHHALRVAINAVLDAYRRETPKAFGVGLLVGAAGMLVLLLGGGGG